MKKLFARRAVIMRAVWLEPPIRTRLEKTAVESVRPSDLARLTSGLPVRGEGGRERLYPLWTRDAWR